MVERGRDGPRLRLLGPIQVVGDDGGPADVGGLKRRGLLALLMLGFGGTVSRERLIDGLWIDPPASAVNGIQVNVSHLRRVLPEHTSIEFDGSGYRLLASDDDIDWVCFERACNRATGAGLQDRFPEAVEAADTALDLWGGMPLQGLDELPFVPAERQHLIEMRDQTFDEAAAQLIALGRADEAVTRLAGLVNESPHREHRWSLLIRALVATGRAADALDAYQTVRRRLADDLGLEPGASLQEAEQDALTGGATTKGASTAPDAGGSIVSIGPELERLVASPCFGREAEIERAGRAMAEGGLVIWKGDAGTGKTRVAAEVARRSVDDHRVALYGRHGAERFVPYQAWGEVLSAAARQVPGWLAAMPESTRQTLGRLLPDVASLVPGRGREDDVDRHRLFASVADALAAIGSVTPASVLLDDFHWADTGSTALTAYLAGRGLPPGIALMVTCRPQIDDPAVAAFVRELGEWATVIDVAGLDVDAAHQLLDHLGRADPDDDLPRLVRLSRGNPLVLMQFPHDAATAFADELTELDPSARIDVVVEDRLRMLPDVAESILEAAAVAGLTWSVGDLSAVTDESEATVIDALEACAATGVVAESSVDDHFEFGHALYRATLYRRVSRARRSRMHATLARHLSAGATSEHVRCAYHAVEARDQVDPTFLKEAVARATRQLELQFAPDRAALVLQRLFEDDRLPEVTTARERSELACDRARLHCLAGDWDRARDLYIAQATEARRRDEGVVLARIALEIDDGGRAVRHIGPRLELLDESRRRVDLRTDDRPESVAMFVRVASEWAAEANQFGRGLRAVETEALEPYMDEVVERARECSSDLALAAALFARQSVADWRPDVDLHARLLAEVTDVAERSGADRRLHEALLGQTRVSLQRGDVEAAEEYRRRHGALGVSTGHPRTQWFARMQEATLARMHGRLDEADDLAADMLDFGLDKHIPDAVGAFEAAMFFSLFHRGAVASLRERVEAAVEAEPHNPLWRLGAGIAQAEDGDDRAAQSSFDQVMAELPDMPRNEFWASVLMMATELAGRVDPAPEGVVMLEDLLTPWSGLFIVMGSGITTLGPADRALATLASLRGDAERASSLAHSGDELCDEIGAAVWRSAADVS